MCDVILFMKEWEVLFVIKREDGLLRRKDFGNFVLVVDFFVNKL